MGSKKYEIKGFLKMLKFIYIIFPRCVTISSNNLTIGQPRQKTCLVKSATVSSFLSVAQSTGQVKHALTLTASLDRSNIH